MTGLLCLKKHYDKNMKKLLILFLILFINTTTLTLASDDLWDNFGDQNVYGQKAVSDKEFNSIIDKLKNKKKKPKVKDKDLKNGESFQQSSETEFIQKMPSELPVLLVPLSLELAEGAILPIGHYQVVGKKENGKVYLKLYQSKTLMANLQATETNDDYNQTAINFVKLIEHNPNQILIIYGSVDFNAYTVVDVAPLD